MRLYYCTSWQSGAVHFCPSGSSEWRDAPLAPVSGFPDWREATLDAQGGAEFVVRDDGGHWDNNGGKNYRLQAHGEVWALKDGRLGRVSAAAPLLVVSDLDRTLFGHEFDKPTGRVLDPGDQALSEFMAVWYEHYALGGSHLVYCTGRDKKKALATLAEKHVPRPSLLICGVGTEIYEVPRDLPLCGGQWAAEPDRIRLNSEWSAQMAGFQRDAVWKVLREQFPRFRSYDGDCAEKNPHRVSSVYPIDDNLPEGVAKQSKEEFDRVIEQLRQILSSPVQVIPSGNNGGWSCVDFCPQAAGKLSGLNFAMSHLHVAPERTLACGDSGNDEGLYRSPGTRCVAVANSMDALCEILRQEARCGSEAVRKGRDFETRSGSVVFYATQDTARGVLEALSHFWPDT